MLFAQHRLALANVGEAKLLVASALFHLVRGTEGIPHMLWADGIPGLLCNRQRWTDVVTAERAVQIRQHHEAVVRMAHYASSHNSLSASLTRLLEEERKAEIRAADQWSSLKSLYRRTTRPNRIGYSGDDAYELFYTRARSILDRSFPDGG